jgi:hypothetical protein
MGRARLCPYLSSVSPISSMRRSMFTDAGSQRIMRGLVKSGQILLADAEVLTNGRDRWHQSDG